MGDDLGIESHPHYGDAVQPNILRVSHGTALMTKTIYLPTGEGIPNRRKNGNGKLVWWALGLMTTLTLTGMGRWIGFIDQKVEAVQLTNTKREGQIATLSTQMVEVSRRLGVIETKLDSLIERKR